MKFFAKVTFIFNVCFLISVIFRLVEISRQVKGNSNGVLGYQPLESTLVVMGYGAIFINIVFVILYMVRYATKRGQGIRRWIAFFNLILLPAQIYYFFFLNI